MGVRVRKKGRERFEFVVPGPLYGYRQTTLRSIFHPKERARSKAYARFKEKVLLLAMDAGIHGSRLGRAKEEDPPYLSVVVFWKNGPRIDFKNLYGSLEDSCWYEDDSYVMPGAYSEVHWKSGKEEAWVIVEW